MKSPIFLSASIPDHKPFDQDYDPIAIREAILALVSVAARERLIVFGGHPAISPVVEHAARSLDALDNIHIYQSRFFEDKIPEVARRFQNFHWTPVENDSQGHRNRAASLEVMRRTIITKYSFASAYFIGGMEGIFDEYKIFTEHYPHAKLAMVASGGGGASQLFRSKIELYTSKERELLESENRFRRVIKYFLPTT